VPDLGDTADDSLAVGFDPYPQAEMVRGCAASMCGSPTYVSSLGNEPAHGGR
jgi:hypothetical protein